jgi:DnaJ-class molecular chaperone
MTTCTRCHGEGYLYDEEEGLGSIGIMDACSHCGTTGMISEEEAYRDKLVHIASGLAYQYVNGYKKYKEEDPEGEGFEFCAAERGLSSFDYFKILVWEKTDEYMKKIDDMGELEQKELVRRHTAGENIELD